MRALLAQSWSCCSSWTSSSSSWTSSSSSWTSSSSSWQSRSSSTTTKSSTNSFSSGWRCTPPGLPSWQWLASAALPLRGLSTCELVGASAPPSGSRPRDRRPQSNSSSSTRSGNSRWLDSPSSSSRGGPGDSSRGQNSSSSRSSPNIRWTKPPWQHPQQQQRGQGESRPSARSDARKLSPAQVTDLISKQDTLADLLELLRRHSSPDYVIHINAALQWLVRHPRERPRPPEQLAALVQQQVQGLAIENMSARNCANLAYYCSKLGYVEDLGLYRALLQRFMVVRGEAKPQEVANLLYALGSQERLRGLLHQPVVLGLLRQLQQLADDAKPQELSNALWAAAKVEPGDSPQLGQVVAQLLGRFLSTLGSAKPQAVSNTLYALALLPRAWPMDSALQLVSELAHPGSEALPQNMSNVLWALGRCVERGWLAPLSERPRPRLQVAVNSLMSALADGGKAVKPQDVSNSLWGVAVLQAQVDWRLVGQLLGHVTQQQPNSQDLANACWAVAKLHQLHGAPSGQQQLWQQPYSKAVQAFVPLLPKATAQAVSNMLWACGQVGHHPLQLLQVLTAASAPLSQLQQANAQNVSNLSWALAVLAPGPLAEPLLASLLQRMQDLLAQQPAAVNSQVFANTAWAVAVLDQQQLAGQLEPLAAAAFSQQQWAGSQAEDLRQWHQVHLWLTDTQVLGPDGLGAFPGVSQQQLVECREAWEQALASDAKASQVQREVAKVLSSMPAVEVMGSEQRDQHDGSRSIDIVARYKGQLLAVEVDGPHHFTWPWQRPTGLTLARNRALERRGYRVVTVPVVPDWRQQRSQQQRQQYLQGLLDAAVEQLTAVTEPSTSSSA